MVICDVDRVLALELDNGPRRTRALRTWQSGQFAPVRTRESESVDLLISKIQPDDAELAAEISKKDSNLNFSANGEDQHFPQGVDRNSDSVWKFVGFLAHAT